MAEKRNFIIFRALFFLNYISYKNDLSQVEILLGVLIEEKKVTSKIIKKSVMASQKYQNMSFEAALLKDF